MSTTVQDYSSLECRFRESSNSMIMDLKVGGQWTQTDGTVVDQITAGSSITDVDAHFDPDSGYEYRIRFRPSGEEWGSWSSWTNRRVTQTIAVPGAGLTYQEDFDAELRVLGQTNTVALGGYIRVKKLNSGG